MIFRCRTGGGVINKIIWNTAINHEMPRITTRFSAANTDELRAPTAYDGARVPKALATDHVLVPDVEKPRRTTLPCPINSPLLCTPSRRAAAAKSTSIRSHPPNIAVALSCRAEDELR